MVTISSSAVGTAAASAAYALVAWVWSAVTYEYSLLENGRHLAHVLLAVTLLAVTVGAALATSSSGNESGAWLDYVLGCSIALSCLAILRTYREFISGPTCPKQDMSGKTVVITGANSGIGRETAKALAKMGANVILACRNMTAAEKEIKMISRELGCNGSRMSAMKLDLGNLTSVREFVEQFKSKEIHLDVLICNAGVMLEKRLESADGHEMNFAVNHLGHFLLANELLPLIEKSSDGRIVIVTSGLHRISSGLDFDDLMTEKGYTMFRAYSRSKLAGVMYAVELQDRLIARNPDCKTLVGLANPGNVLTPISRGMAWYMRMGDALAWPVLVLLRKQPSQGATTPCYVAVSPELRSGSSIPRTQYYTHCTVQAYNPAANDATARKRLWEMSEALAGKSQ